MNEKNKGRKFIKRITGFALALMLILTLIPVTSIPVAANDVYVTAVSAGFSHSLAILSDGSLWAWGSNDSGQLGDGTNVDKHIPVKIMDDVMAINAGAWSSFAIKNDGTLWAWGYNSYGQLGDSTTVDRHTPVHIMDNVKSFSMRGEHSLVIKSDGSLWAWGDNWSGKLGDGTQNNSATPVHIMDNVTAISAGGHHSLAIKSDGSLFSWGSNWTGQLGYGDIYNVEIPVHITDSITAISAGGLHSLVIKSDGSLWAWGHNSYGQLGDSTTIEKYTPVHIMDNVIEINAGGYHSLVITNDGSLWAWGENWNGKVGDGTTTHRNEPIKIMDNMIAVSGGNRHSLAIKGDGTLWAWGSNEFGGLGDGTTIDRYTPVQVIFESANSGICDCVNGGVCTCDGVVCECLPIGNGCGCGSACTCSACNCSPGSCECPPPEGGGCECENGGECTCEPGECDCGGGTGYIDCDCCEKCGPECKDKLPWEEKCCDYCNCKPDLPTPEKSVKDKNEAWQKHISENVGQTADFRVTSVVPNLISQYITTSAGDEAVWYDDYTFIMTDTMSGGLTFDPNSIKIGVAAATSTSIDDAITVPSSNYSITYRTRSVGGVWSATSTSLAADYNTAENNRGTIVEMEIKFNNLIDFFKDGAGSALASSRYFIFEYSAALNEFAIQDNNSGRNEVFLKYGTDPDNLFETFTIETVVFTLELDVFKYAVEGEEGARKALAGAEFVLLSGASGNQAVSFTGDNGSYRYNGTVTIADLNNIGGIPAAAVIVSPAAGIINLEGLAAGTYRLVEIKAPDGYNKLENPISVIIDYNTKLVNNKLQINQILVNTVGDGRVEIENKPFILPPTGGIGRVLFYVIGGGLLFGTVTILFVRSRMKKPEDDDTATSLT